MILCFQWNHGYGSVLGSLFYDDHNDIKHSVKVVKLSNLPRAS